jgi:hypothetical protein
MTERRYNDDEVAAIFAKAAEGQQTPAGVPAEDGLTLSELQDIGREVGIAPEAVTRAARSLALYRPAPTRRFLGFPLSVERTVTFSRRLTEGEWEQLVVQLRQVFNARGTLRTDGSFRQWTNGNLQALLEPTPTGQRLRLRTLNGAARSWISAGLVALGTSTAVAISLALGGHLANGTPGVVLLSTIGLGMLASGALRLPGWARLRRRQMEDIAAGLALQPGSPAGDPPTR